MRGSDGECQGVAGAARGWRGGAGGGRAGEGGPGSVWSGVSVEGGGGRGRMFAAPGPSGRHEAMVPPERFSADALANPVKGALLGRRPDLGIDQPWLVAGCVYQAVWNCLAGRPPAENVKDYDVFYWDEDTSW